MALIRPAPVIQCDGKLKNVKGITSLALARQLKIKNYELKILGSLKRYQNI